MRLEEIVNNPAIMMHLRWDMTKEKLARTTFNPGDAGFYFCIFVRNGRACLALVHYHPGGQVTQDYMLDFPEDMILAALKEAEGSTDASGYYPINHLIKEMLRLGLVAKGKEKLEQGMQTDGIKDPALKKLFAETEHASSTLKEDAFDALSESKNDEDLINNWQPRLMDLYNECQHYWGELEKMKSKAEPKKATPSEELDLTGWSVSYTNKERRL